MQLPLTLRPQPSRALALALVLAHGLTAAGLAATELLPTIKLMLCLGLALSLAFVLRRNVWRLPIRTLTLQADGALEVERRDGTRASARVHPQTTVFPWLCVLRLKLDATCLALTFPPDAFDAEAYRQLCLWLRWKAAR